MWARLARWNRGIANAIGSLIVSKSGGEGEGEGRPEGGNSRPRRESLRRRGGTAGVGELGRGRR